MKKSVKLLLIIGSILTFVGVTLFTITMFSVGWDFKALSSVQRQENTYEITQEFESINITVDTTDVVFENSTSESAKVVCYEREDNKFSIDVIDGVLTISENHIPWYKNINLFDFSSCYITVYLPSGEYNDLSIKASTGDITVKNTNLNKVDLSVSTGTVLIQNTNIKTDLKIDVSTGDIKIYNTNCHSLVSSGTTGDLELNNVIASGSFTIKRNTGSIEIENSDASEITIETSTGDVEMSLLSSKIFVTQTSTGDVNVPVSTSGGLCSIKTSTGDIEVIIIP